MGIFLDGREGKCTESSVVSPWEYRASEYVSCSSSGNLHHHFSSSLTTQRQIRNQFNYFFRTPELLESWNGTRELPRTPKDSNSNSELLQYFVFFTIPGFGFLGLHIIDITASGWTLCMVKTCFHRIKNEGAGCYSPSSYKQKNTFKK